MLQDNSMTELGVPGQLSNVRGMLFFVCLFLSQKLETIQGPSTDE